MRDRNQLPVSTSIALLVVATAVIYVEGVRILIAHAPYMGRFSHTSVDHPIIPAPISFGGVSEFLGVTLILSLPVWGVLCLIDWAKRKISGRALRRADRIVYFLMAVDLTGFLTLWILPKIV